MRVLNMDIGACEKSLLLGYKKVFDSVPHSERTHAPRNNVIFNVWFTCNNVKDLDLVVVDTYKKRFCKNAISKRKFRVKPGSMIRTVVKSNKAHRTFDKDAPLWIKKTCKPLHFKLTYSECFESSKMSTAERNDDWGKISFIFHMIILQRKLPLEWFATLNHTFYSSVIMQNKNHTPQVWKSEKEWVSILFCTKTEQKEINASLLLLDKNITRFSLVSNKKAAYGSAMSIHTSGCPTTAFEPLSQLQTNLAQGL